MDNAKSVCDKTGKWTNANIYDGFAIYSNCKGKVGYLACVTLLYILYYYDRAVLGYKGDAACYLSYEDISIAAGCSKNMAIKAIKELLSANLVECINPSSRKGRDKYGYKPKLKEIEALKKAYLKRNEIDKDKP